MSQAHEYLADLAGYKNYATYIVGMYWTNGQEGMEWERRARNAYEAFPGDQDERRGQAINHLSLALRDRLVASIPTVGLPLMVRELLGVLTHEVDTVAIARRIVDSSLERGKR